MTKSTKKEILPANRQWRKGLVICLIACLASSLVTPVLWPRPTSAQEVTNVTSTNSDRTYTTGDNIYINVTFNQEVYISGLFLLPYLELETGNTDRFASYVRGNGSDTLTFRYTVRSGDSSADLDYKRTNSLDCIFCSIKDADGNDVDLTLATPGEPGSLSYNRDLVIDTTAPIVTSVTSTQADGIYSTGDVIDITVTFNEEVEVTGKPYLELETGSTDRVASYVRGSGSDTLTFRYTVHKEDSSADLDYRRTSSLKRDDGTIKDVAGNDAELALPAPGKPGSLSYDKDLVIDTNLRVTGVNSDKGNGSYSTGEVIDITVTFSEEVDVDTDDGTPYLELETGSTDRDASYVSGSGTNALTFRYKVHQGDSSADLDYRATDSLKLNGGTINDDAGNDAELTLATPGEMGSLGANKTLVIDTAAPMVTGVTSLNTNGTYKNDQVIDVTVTFSEKVDVDTDKGIPCLEMETGTTDRDASYISGSGTDTLTFRYAIQEGDVSSDLDYQATDSLKLNGGAIKDAAGNGAKLKLATPGETGSLGASKTLVIDADSIAKYAARFPGIDTESVEITTFRNQVPTDIDASDKADIMVHFRYTGIVTGEVMIARYNEEPAFPAVQFSGPESEGGTEMEGIKFVDIYASGFNKGTAIVTINYTDDELSDFEEDILSLYYWDGSAWQKVENIFRYTDTNIIQGEVPVSALGGTPIGLGGGVEQEQDGSYIHFIVLGTLGGIAIMAFLIWLFWYDRKKNPVLR